MNEVFEKIKDLRILIIGDIILDKYYFTEVERISPEAPIPIARFKNEEKILGGAANVAKGISNLGAKTYLIGQIGNDNEGKDVEKLCKINNIKLIPIKTNERTISKTRIISNNSQLLRLDFEEKDLHINQKLVIENINATIDNIDLIIVSDYQKGLIKEETINYLKKTNKYISIDTKPGTFTCFKGFNLVKPNFKEALGIAQKLGNDKNFKNTNEDIEELGKYLRKKLNSNLLITRSEEGASYIGKEIFHAKNEINKLVDVTGAGDTSILVFSIFDYLNVEKHKCLEIMNAAAKISVNNLGNYNPTLDEIKKELFKEKLLNVLSLKELILKVNDIKKQNKKIVFTNGCFDILHKGHVSLLKKAKKFGDILIVGINSDTSVKKIKGENRPLIDEDSRAFVLSNLKDVDYVTIFDEDTPENIISLIKPDIHVKGGDYKIEDLPETKIVHKYGGEVKIINSNENISTSSIEKKIKS